MGRKRAEKPIRNPKLASYRLWTKRKGVEDSMGLPFWITFWTPRCVRESVRRYRHTERGKEMRRKAEKERYHRDDTRKRYESALRWKNPWNKARRLKYERELRARKSAIKYLRSINRLKRRKREK